MFRVPYTGFMLDWRSVISIVFAVLLAISLGFNWYFSKRIDSLKDTITKNNMASDFAIQLAKKDVKIITEYKIIIEKQYIPQKIYIDNFKKDENETSCDAANRLTNSFVF